MMKLKHLFSNTDLAYMLFRSWDIAQNPEIRHFRSSANAVYVLHSNDSTYFLRITPVEEKSPSEIAAELDFLSYLHAHRFPAVRSVPAANGKALITADTPWGLHSMVVFEKVSGKCLEHIPYSAAAYIAYGQALGRLHQLSKRYQPEPTVRPSWQDKLAWCGQVADDYSAPPALHAEIQLIRTALTALPQTQDNYGLVHYDFELDNVFYDDATGMLTPIDFDDAMYHWYALDVEQSLDSIRSELPEADQGFAVKDFLAGYQKEMGIDERMLEALPLFRRFCNLYQYVRCLRSLYEQWQNEPEWMVGLRRNIERTMKEREATFGTPLS